jgi:hypothetical protein
VLGENLITLAAIDPNTMTILIHEIWEVLDDDGQVLPACLFAGPRGDEGRRLLGPNACLVHTFKAGSHFEAMTIYYDFYRWGVYTTDHASDVEPYPDEWAKPTL